MRSFAGVFAIIISLLVNQDCQAQAALSVLSADERTYYDYIYQKYSSATPLDTNRLRTPAEWEEMDGLVIAWQNFPEIHREIVRYASREGQIYVLCEDSLEVSYDLRKWEISLDSVNFIQRSIDCPWVRDYGANSVYEKGNASRKLIDWHYNRSRPNDDIASLFLADELNIPIHNTVEQPYNLVHTGGNFITDGFGTAFSSKLILQENPGKSEAAINQIMRDFMGIRNYVKMDVLPYDGIHHIDMHMKLLDEETLLVGQYPEGVADGPQIEENLRQLLEEVKTVFGTPFKVVRIPMPPEEVKKQGEQQHPVYRDNGRVPYYTYTNSLIFNKLVLVPMFSKPYYDSLALNTYREAMPGYTVKGINSVAAIARGGAIHCLTKGIAARNPLLIAHQEVGKINATDRGYRIEALVEHASGIEQATVYFRWKGEENFQQLPMCRKYPGENHWEAIIPAGHSAKEIEYYIRATANTGKQQVRPLPAPRGHWNITVVGEGSI